MTRVDADPRDDEAAAKRRDLDRLTELIVPHLPDHATTVAAAFPHMTPADLAEVEAVLARLGDDTEDAEAAWRRQQWLLRLAQLEATALDILKHGQPRLRNGKVLYDPQTGEPLRNRNIDRSARALLRRIQRERSRWTGLPPSADDEAPS